MMKKVIPDIVRGHEIWLEHDIHYINIGKTFECKLLFGHNMAVDGTADVENVKASVFNPQNEKSDLAVEAGDGGLIVTFDPGIDGHHLIAAEYDAGIYTVTEDGWHKGPKNEYENVKRSGFYYQYAKTIICGNGKKELNPEIGHELEIIPTDFGHHHVGGTIGLKVLYDGAALTPMLQKSEGARVKAPRVKP